MDKNRFAPTPPMGWNSYDYYDTAVTEEQVRENAAYLAEHLKEYGWQYVVVDIEWYAWDAGTRRAEYQYIPFGKVEMDEYSRLLPCTQRFPSGAGGKGFGPLADYVHSLGLKFGIHMMRGIPRIAAHLHTAVKGTEETADEIADPSSICAWNPDMYGLRPEKAGAQAYYDSLMELYAGWGVDLIKCDDICRMDMPGCRAEIRMLHEAIMRCGREIVLSLSPGPARPEEAWLYADCANLWRITDDFWDDWNALKEMFRRCEIWQDHVRDGCFPDCDMLPLGRIGRAFGDERETRLTRAEQRTMMNLWCVFRSPLMIGAKLTELDGRTLELLTNRTLIRSLKSGSHPTQLRRNEDEAVWMNLDRETGAANLALFNLSGEERTVSLKLSECAARGARTAFGRRAVRSAWEDTAAEVSADGTVSVRLAPHDSAFLSAEACG